jgi:hypothetical protein
VLRDNFTAVGAKLNIIGGSIGAQFEVVDTLATISGGTIGDEFYTFTGSVVNVSGGRVGNAFAAIDGSLVNISGGTFGDYFSDLFYFQARSGSTVNIPGGRIDSPIIASGSTVNISGGRIDSPIIARDSSEVNLFGAEFFFNNRSLEKFLTPGEAFTISSRPGTLSGRWADGSAFSFDFTFLDEARFTVTLLVPEPATCVIVFTALLVAAVYFRSRLEKR